MRQVEIKFWVLILIMGQAVFAQEKIDTILDSYIRVGQKNNQALKQKDFSYQKSSAALNEARGMFLPSLSIEARYSRAGGGRDIIFPVGDLMNPVYNSLNQLFAASGLPQQPYPVLKNETIPFLREKEHETKLRLVQPVLQPALYYNYQLKDNLVKASQAELEAYKNELTKEIKTAYFKYLQTDQLVSLFEGTRELLNENIRVSQALFENEMVTKDVVFRANSEKLKLDQQLEEAKHKKTLAKSYFNFLLNKPLDAEIKIGRVTNPVKQITTNLKLFEDQALGQRNEIRQASYALSATENVKGISTSSYLPNLNLVVDFGYQGEKYRFGKKDDYWMASAIFSWNLFNGFKDKAKREMAVLDNKTMQSRFTELQNQIRMQVQNAFLGLRVGQKSLVSAKEQETQAKESFKIISKKYEEGIASQIEFIDARVNLTNAGINKIVTEYDLFIKLAEMDFALGIKSE